MSTPRGLVSSVKIIRPLFNARLYTQEQVIEAELLQSLPSLAESVSNEIYRVNRGKEAECLALVEYNLRNRKLEKSIRDVKEESQTFAEEASLASMLAGKKTLNDIIKMRLAVWQRDLLTRWKLFTLSERRYANLKATIGLKTALQIVDKGMVKLGQGFFFNYLRQRVQMLRSWELYRVRTVKMVEYWMQRTLPNLKKYLLCWRSNAILRHFHAMQQTHDWRVLMPAKHRQLLDLLEEKTSAPRWPSSGRRRSTSPSPKTCRMSGFAITKRPSCTPP